MQQLEVICPSYGKLFFIGKELYKGSDSLVLSNCSNHSPDVLLFFDSRGISTKYKGSLVNRIIDHYVQLKKTYLLIVRPLELTTWATFANFMVINNIVPGKIITNMGFVDFTPKKKSVLQDALQQAEYYAGKDCSVFEFKCNYKLSSGMVEPLYGMNYRRCFVKEIEKLLFNHEIIVVNTPLVRRDINIERSRPNSFFEGLLFSNEFNNGIGIGQVVDLPLFDEKFTYDAVHYTNDGNAKIFKIVKKIL